MRIRTEVEIECATPECNKKTWSLTTFTLNDTMSIKTIPGNADLVEEYSTEHELPKGWSLVEVKIPARKGSHSGYTYNKMVCFNCASKSGLDKI